jgi:hypothetical protein
MIPVRGATNTALSAAIALSLGGGGGGSSATANTVPGNGSDADTATFTLGGTVGSLPGGQALTLLNNGGDALSIDADRVLSPANPPTPTLACRVVPDVLSIAGDAATGALLYAASRDPADVAALRIDPATGQLAVMKPEFLTLSSAVGIVSAAFAH